MAQEQTRQFIEQATQSIQSGQFDAALRLIDQALAIDPSDPDALVLRGICQSQTNQPAAATESFQSAIALEPTNVKAKYNLAVHLYAQGQKREALQSAREAVDLDPNHNAARQLISTIETEFSGSATVAPTHNDPLAAPPVTPTTGEVAPPPAGTTFSQPSQPQPPAAGQPQGTLPPAANPYYKQGDEEPAHSLPFVEGMGGTWTGVGWGLAVLDLALFVTFLSMYLPVMRQAFAANGSPDQFTRQMQAMPATTFVQIAAWGVRLLVLVYTVLDLVDRRGNYIWLLPSVICTCCGCGWVSLPVYMFAGRNK